MAKKKNNIIKTLTSELDTNEDAYLELGYAYWNGEGVTKSKTKALDIWKEGSQKGRGNCSYHLGELYEKGLIVNFNEVEARRYYQLAHEQGYALGTYRYAYCLELGIGVFKNIEEAQKYYKIAYDRGIEKAKEKLK